MTKTIALPFLMAGLAFAAPAEASRRGWDRASNVGEAAVVAAALGVPVARADWQGAFQAGGSIGAAGVVAYGLKEAIPETRPDRSDRRSFPSGHASISFAAAASLHQRYGWQVGLPATLAATFVGVARVEAKKHYWYDVVAGAAIGEASGFLIGHPLNGNVSVLPWGDSHGGGVSAAMRF